MIYISLLLNALNIFAAAPNDETNQLIRNGKLVGDFRLVAGQERFFLRQIRLFRFRATYASVAGALCAWTAITLRGLNT